MKNLLPGVWQWSWFSEEMQLDFNGLLLTVGEHRILVDPPPMTAEAGSLCRRMGPLDYILVTNRDHVRETVTYRQEFSCQVYVPDADASHMDLSADMTYQDGALLPGGIVAIHLSDQKSPGESALFLQHGKGILILGDALIGSPPGALSMLPAGKYADITKARAGLQRLLQYNFDTLLAGDGVSILTGAIPVVARALSGPSEPV